MSRARIRLVSALPGERGSMLVEFIFLTVLVMVPLLYLVGTLGRLQAGAYAASGAAREAGRAYVTSPEAASAPGRGQVAAGLVLDAHGFTRDQATVSVSCDAAGCLEPDSRIRVDVSLHVPVPLVPDFVSGFIPTSVSMTASHVETVDRFRSG